MLLSSGVLRGEDAVASGVLRGEDAVASGVLRGDGDMCHRGAREWR